MELPVDDLVNLFDNEICYSVMTADSMRDHLLDANDNIEDEIRQFYFIEAMYYSNKAISQLFYFKLPAKNAIQTNDSPGGVWFSRFQNVCAILSQIYKALIRFSTDNNNYKPLLDDGKKYIEKFNDLVNHIAKECDIPELKDINQLVISVNTEN